MSDTNMPKAMSQRDQQLAFTHDIEMVLDRYRSEFELTLSSAVGVLEIVKQKLILEVLDSEDQDPES